MQGEVWGVHLGWSGNHRLRAEVKTDGRRYLQAEALYLPGEMALAEGETCGRRTCMPATPRRG
jgi:alpha-galactosidase